MSDVRQSPHWAKYLEAHKWKSFRTKSGINIEIRKTILGSLVKIQKPDIFSRQDLVEIENICRMNKALFIKIEPQLSQDVQILKDAGYKISWFPMTPTSTIYIDLSKSEEELWNNISHSGKYSIHRAEREGAKVKYFRHPKPEVFLQFYTILKETGRMHKIYIPPADKLLKQVEAFGDDGHLVMVYNGKDELCGAKWNVGYKDTVLYASGGTSADGRKDKSGYLLLWKAILYLKSMGYKTYDLEGKDDSRFPNFTKTWGGFSYFKEKFGGEEIVFPHPHVKYLNPLMKFMHKHFMFSV